MKLKICSLLLILTVFSLETAVFASCKDELQGSRVYLDTSLFEKKFKLFLGQRSSVETFSYKLTNQFLFSVRDQILASDRLSLDIPKGDTFDRLSLITGAQSWALAKTSNGASLSLKSLNEIILGFNWRLAVGFARSKYINWPGVELQDIFQQALEGIVIGITRPTSTRYILEEKGAFSVVAMRRMRSSVNIYLKKSLDWSRNLTIRSLVRLFAIIRIIDDDLRLLERRVGYHNTSEYFQQIANIYNDSPNRDIDISAQEVKKILYKATYILSVDRTIEFDVDGVNQRDSDYVSLGPWSQPALTDVRDEQLKPLESIAENMQLAQRIKAQLETKAGTQSSHPKLKVGRYTVNEVKVLRLRFGLFEMNGVSRNRGEIGKVIGLSRQRVEQIENQALVKFRSSELYRNYSQYFESKTK